MNQMKTMRNRKHELLVLGPSIVIGVILDMGLIYIFKLESIDMLFISIIAFTMVFCASSIFHNSFLILEDGFLVYKSFLGFKLRQRLFNKEDIEGMIASIHKGIHSDLGYKWIDIILYGNKKCRVYCVFYPCESFEDATDPENADYTFEDLQGEFYQKEYPISRAD